MIALSSDPIVVIELNHRGQIKSIASNISNNLNVVVCNNQALFKEEAKGKPFDTTRPIQPIQILRAYRKSARKPRPLREWMNGGI